jgi:hypothetical protein
VPTKPSNYGITHNALLEQEPGSKTYKTYDHGNRFGILGSSRRLTLEGLATPLDKQSLILDQIRQEPHLGITTAKLTLKMQTLAIAMGTVYQLHAPAAAIACQNLEDHV